MLRKLFVIFILITVFYGCSSKQPHLLPMPEGVKAKYGASYARIDFYDEIIMDVRLFGLWNIVHDDALYNQAFIMVSFRKYDNKTLTNNYYIDPVVLNIDYAQARVSKTAGLKQDSNGGFNLTEMLNQSEANLVMIEYSIKGEPEIIQGVKHFTPYQKQILIDNIYRNGEKIPAFNLNICYSRMWGEKGCAFFNKINIYH